MERKLPKIFCEKCGRETHLLYESFIENFKFLCKDCSYIEMLSYLEEISARFGEKINQQIKALKEQNEKREG